MAGYGASLGMLKPALHCSLLIAVLKIILCYVGVCALYRFTATAQWLNLFAGIIDPKYPVGSEKSHDIIRYRYILFVFEG